MEDGKVFNSNLFVIVTKDGKVQNVYSPDADAEFVVVDSETKNTTFFGWPEIQFDDEAVEELLGDNANNYIIDEEDI